MRPNTIRPWLTARMLGFRLTDAETRALEEFMSDLKDREAPLLMKRDRSPRRTSRPAPCPR